MMNTSTVKLYRKIIDQMRAFGALDTQVAGMPTLVFKGQAFCGLSFNSDMVFRFGSADRATALKLKGTKPFDLMGGQPAKGWVQIPLVHAERWSSFALAAFRSLVEQLKKS